MLGVNNTNSEDKYSTGSKEESDEANLPTESPRKKFLAPLDESYSKKDFTSGSDGANSSEQIITVSHLL
jgi:hypothetical protein